MHYTIIKSYATQKFKVHTYTYLDYIYIFLKKRFGSTISNKLSNADTLFRVKISTLSKCRILLRNHSIRASSIHSAFGALRGVMIHDTDYGRSMKPFLLKSIPFGLGQTNWANKFWGIWSIWGVFSPFCNSECLVHVFHYLTIISTKN